MKGVKRNPDRKQNIEMRRLIDDPDSRQQPLEILKEKIPVFEKPEHAQVHADTCDQPAFLGRFGLRFGDLAAQPEIHRRSCEKERRKRGIPRAVKNVAGDDEQILSQLPTAKAPVERKHDNVKDDESERIKKHG